MHDQIGEFAIVRQEKETGGIQVEPSDRKDPSVFFGDEIQDRLSSLGIVKGADVASRLVEEEVAMLFVLLPYPFSVDQDFVRLVTGETDGDRLAVDLDATFLDEFFGFASGTVAHGRKDFLNSFFFHMSLISMELF